MSLLLHVEQSERRLWAPSMFLALSQKIILGLLLLVNEIEGTRVIDVLL